MINYDYPTLFLSSVLICDTVSSVGGINVGPDTIQPELTKVGGIPISAALEIRSDFGGVRLPKLTQAAINNMIMDDGMIFYNADNPSVQFRINGNTETFTQGDGDVAGPGASVDGNLPAFDGTDGKLLQDSGILMTEVVISNNVGSSNVNNIAVFVNDTGILIGDSGVAITQVPALTGLNTADVNVNQLSEIGIINFETPDISVLGASLAITGTVPALGFRFANIFMTNTDNKASIVFSNNPSALPSSESASIEIQSDKQAILLSRMTTTEINSIVQPTNGMIAYDNMSNKFKFRENSLWVSYANILTEGYISGIDTGGTTDNLFIGIGAGNIAIVGTGNISAGYGSGATNVNGNNVICIGKGADVSLDGLTNAITIGNNTIVGASNSLILGNNVNVGIGTSIPKTSLHVVGGQTGKVTHVTGPSNTYTVQNNDYIVSVEKGAVPTTIYLPVSSTNEGQLFIIKNNNGADTALSIQVTGGGLIDGNTVFFMSNDGSSLALFSDGNEYNVWSFSNLF